MLISEYKYLLQKKNFLIDETVFGNGHLTYLSIRLKNFPPKKIQEYVLKHDFFFKLETHKYLFFHALFKLHYFIKALILFFLFRLDNAYFWIQIGLDLLKKKYSLMKQPLVMFNSRISIDTLNFFFSTKNRKYILKHEFLF